MPNNFKFNAIAFPSALKLPTQQSGNTFTVWCCITNLCNLAFLLMSFLLLSLYRTHSLLREHASCQSCRQRRNQRSNPKERTLLKDTPFHTLFLSPTAFIVASSMLPVSVNTSGMGLGIHHPASLEAQWRWMLFERCKQLPSTSSPEGRKNSIRLISSP